MTVITDYIDHLPAAEQKVWLRLRTIIYEIAPDAQDAYSYGIPTYRYKGKYLIGFASNKKFLSIYPGGRAIIELADDKLAPFKTGRGTLSFSAQHPIPASLLRQIVRGCKKDIDQTRAYYK